MRGQPCLSERQKAIRLCSFCRLVNLLGFVPNARKFPPLGAQAFQPGAFGTRVSAPFAPAPVAGGPLKGHLGIKGYNFLVCHTATMPDCELPRNLSFGAVSVNKERFLAKKSAFLAVSIALCRGKVNPVSVKRISFCSGAKRKQDPFSTRSSGYPTRRKSREKLH